MSHGSRRATGFVVGAVVAVALVLGVVWWHEARAAAHTGAAPSPSAAGPSTTTLTQPPTTPGASASALSPTPSAAVTPAAPSASTTALPAPAATGGAGGGSTSTTAPSTPAPAGVDVLVVSAVWDRAQGRAEVSGYAVTIEEGGTCTLTLSLGTDSVSVSAAASPDASTTACGELVVPRSRLVQGTWQGVLRYASATSVGTSLPFSIEVQ